jgi:hypothetical protein
MVFKLNQAAIDLFSGFATVTAQEQTPPGPTGERFKMVRVEFPFTPPAAEANELQQMVTQAKALFQQAANDL